MLISQGEVWQGKVCAAKAPRKARPFAGALGHACCAAPGLWPACALQSRPRGLQLDPQGSLTLPSLPPGSQLAQRPAGQSLIGESTQMETVNMQKGKSLTPRLNFQEWVASSATETEDTLQR